MDPSCFSEDDLLAVQTLLQLKSGKEVHKDRQSVLGLWARKRKLSTVICSLDNINDDNEEQEIQKKRSKKSLGRDSVRKKVKESGIEKEGMEMEEKACRSSMVSATTVSAHLSTPESDRLQRSQLIIKFKIQKKIGELDDSNAKGFKSMSPTKFPTNTSGPLKLSIGNHESKSFRNISENSPSVTAMDRNSSVEGISPSRHSSFVDKSSRPQSLVAMNSSSRVFVVPDLNITPENLSDDSD